MICINLNKVFGSKKSNTTKPFNDIPVSSDIRIIKYEQDGNTKYDVSYTDPYEYYWPFAWTKSDKK